jgi:hypothetical protein
MGMISRMGAWGMTEPAAKFAGKVCIVGKAAELGGDAAPAAWAQPARLGGRWRGAGWLPPPRRW